jgi:hypothetical protein
MWDRLSIRQTGWLPVPQPAGTISLVPQRVDGIEPRGGYWFRLIILQPVDH